MKDKKQTLTKRIVIIAIICLFIAIPLLYVNCFFCDFSSNTFNEVLSPIVLLLTFIFIYFQLQEAQKANEIQVSNQEYNSYTAELMERGRKLKEMKFRVEDNSWKKNESYTELIKQIELANGINYISAFSSFCFIKKHPEDDVNNKLNKDMFNIFIIYFLFPIYREYEALFDFFNEVYDNELMKKKQKLRIFKKAEMDFLQVYFEICNRGDYSGSSKTNDLNSMWKKEFEALIYYDIKYFYKINDFYKNKELFQYRKLEHYQKTEPKQ